VKVPRVDAAYAIREGEAGVQAIELQRFRFARTPAATDHSHLLLPLPPPPPRSP
jgi:hypothetical protein